MKWFLLRSRRQLGPFTQDELVEMLSKGQASMTDFVIREDQVNLGKLNYISLSKIINKNSLSHSEDDSSGLVGFSTPGESQSISHISSETTQMFINETELPELVSDKVIDKSADDILHSTTESNLKKSTEGFIKRFWHKSAPVFIAVVVLLTMSAGLYWFGDEIKNRKIGFTTKPINTEKSSPVFNPEASIPDIKKPIEAQPFKPIVDQVDLAEKRRKREELRKKRAEELKEKRELLQELANKRSRDDRFNPELDEVAEAEEEVNNGKIRDDLLDGEDIIADEDIDRELEDESEDGRRISSEDEAEFESEELLNDDFEEEILDEEFLDDNY